MATKKVPNNNPEQTQKRHKKSESEEQPQHSTVANLIQHIKKTILGSKLTSEDNISEDEFGFENEYQESEDEDTYQKYKYEQNEQNEQDQDDEEYDYEDDYEDYIDEPTIEPSHFDTDDSTTIYLPATTSEEPSTTEEETFNDNTSSNTSILNTRSDTTHLDDMGLSHFYYQSLPKNNKPILIKDNDNQNTDSTSNCFNINRETLYSRPLPPVIYSVDNTNSQLNNEEFPGLPVPININHSFELTNLMNYLSHTTYLNFTSQRPRRNAVQYISYSMPLSNQQMLYNQQILSLPPEIRTMISFANSFQVLPRTNYVPTSPYNNENETYEELVSLCDRVGIVELGVSNIDAVTKYIELEDGKACAICNTDEPDKKYRKIVCEHPDIFCDECVIKWLSKNRFCPVCTKNLEDYINKDNNELQELEEEFEIINDSAKTNI
jgi:hypothetical protein